MIPVWIVHHTEPEDCFTLHTHEVPKGFRVEVDAGDVRVWEAQQQILRKLKVNEAVIHMVLDPSKLWA